MFFIRGVWVGIMSKKENNYTVYMHTSPSEKRYIGITQQSPPEKRWKNGCGYQGQAYFYRAIQKYGWDNFQHEILFKGLTKEEAEQKEIELIPCYDSTNSNKGYNIEYGGNSIGKMSEAQKRKLKEVHTGRRCSEETRKKMSESGKKKVFSKEHRKHLSESKLGKRHTEGTKNKISMNRKDKKGVFQYSKDFIFIKEYESISLANKITGIARQNIISCCNYKRLSAGGYIWRYADGE